MSEAGSGHGEGPAGAAEPKEGPRPPYQELVKQAEAAVEGIRDPELRRVAFEKVLDDLLASMRAEPELGPEAPLARPGGRREKAEAGVARPARRARERERSQGPIGYVKELVDDGFFKKPKTIAEVKAELGNRGHHIALTSLSPTMVRLVRQRNLRRQMGKTTGNKKTYIYSEW